MTNQQKLPQCPHCGHEFQSLRDGKIPTHDFPKPCRSVCPGSGSQQKKKSDTPLWKDDPNQQERDFIESARSELMLYGFAIVKEVAMMRGDTRGQMDCPLCQNPLQYSIAKLNGHCAAKCGKIGCINAME